MFQNISFTSQNVCLHVRKPYINTWGSDKELSFNLVNGINIPSSYFDFRSLTYPGEKYRREKCDGLWGKFSGTNDEYITKVPARPLYKYIRRFGKNKDCVCEKHKKIAILLPEMHANLNVGHSVRDMLFLAQMLTVTTPDVVLVEDKATATGILGNTLSIRKEILSALLVNTNIEVIFLQRNANPFFTNIKRICVLIIYFRNHWFIQVQKKESAY